MNQKFFFIRHGNTFTPKQISYLIGKTHDLPLTSEGLKQAEKLANYFNNQKIIPDKIYCGTLKRQAQTATVLAKSVSLVCKTLVEPSLDEIDYGFWEGLTIKTLEERWPKEYDAWRRQALWPTHIFEKSEFFYLENLKASIEKISQSLTENQNAFIITSQGILRLLLELYYKDWEAIKKALKVSDFKVNTGSFCELHLKDNNNLEIVHWNQTPD